MNIFLFIKAIKYTFYSMIFTYKLISPFILHYPYLFIANNQLYKSFLITLKIQLASQFPLLSKILSRSVLPPSTQYSCCLIPQRPTKPLLPALSRLRLWYLTCSAFTNTRSLVLSFFHTLELSIQRKIPMDQCSKDAAFRFYQDQQSKR